MTESSISVASALAAFRKAVEHIPAGARVCAAMSGGVDSSATAAVLKDMGYDVVGVTMRLFDHAVADKAVADAKAVASALNIPHHVLDLQDAFAKRVMQPFAKTYLQGKTPSPCAVCNRYIKFGALVDYAKELGAVSMATGHYVRRIEGANGPEILCGRDSRRDQSYFLFGVTAEQLAFAAFPLGDLEKAETRAIAAHFDLPVAQKSDSQDICFVPNGKYVDVVQTISGAESQPGDIVDLTGQVVGRHDGVLRYTIGQRRGLGVSAPEPLYVVRLEPAANRVVVGPASALDGVSCRLSGVNWIGEGDLDGRAVSVKLRSASPVADAVLHRCEDGQVEVKLASPFTAIAPGQACVFYDGDRLLGGGWILRPDEVTQT